MKECLCLTFQVLSDNQDISGVFPLHDGPYHHFVRQGGGQVFEGVDYQIDLPLLQGDFKLFGEQILLPNLVQGLVQDLCPKAGVISKAKGPLQKVMNELLETYTQFGL